MNTKLSFYLFSALLLLIVAGCASKPPVVEPEPAPVIVIPEPVVKAPAPVEPIPVPEPKVVEVIPPAPKPVPPTDKAVVYFDFDSSQLKASAQQVIEANSEFLANNPEYKIVIQGHADQRGTDAYNQELSDKRSEAVRKALLASGLDESRIGTVSFGKRVPAVRGNNEEAWHSNRRAVFVYVTGDLQQAIAEQKIKVQAFAFDN